MDIKVPVAHERPGELLHEDRLEGGADGGAGRVIFQDAADVKIHIPGLLVRRAQQLDDFRLHDVRQVFPLVDWAHTKPKPIVDVPPQTDVAAALDVEGHQVVAERQPREDRGVV